MKPAECRGRLATEHWLAVGACLIATATLSGCAEDEDLGSVRAPVDGDLDDGSYPGVMGLFVNKPEGVARCSGVLLAPNLVLTARHCVAPTTASFVDCGSSPLGPAVAPDQALATTDATMPPDDRSLYRAAVRIEVPPDGDDECGFDIAALVLEEPVPSDEATPFPPRLDSNTTGGERFTAVGFGSSRTGGMGVRRVHPDLGVVCVGDSECAEAQVQATEWLAEDGGFCRFDSGAPAIDADGKVLGVVSRGANTCDAPILSSTFAWATWLRGVARDAAATGGYPAPAWASAPPVGADGGRPDAGPSTDGSVEDDGGLIADGATDGGTDASSGAADGGGCTAGGPGIERGGWLTLFLAFGALARSARRQKKTRRPSATSRRRSCPASARRAGHARRARPGG